MTTLDGEVAALHCPEVSRAALLRAVCGPPAATERDAATAALEQAFQTPAGASAAGIRLIQRRQALRCPQSHRQDLRLILMPKLADSCTDDLACSPPLPEHPLQSIKLDSIGCVGLLDG